MVDALKLCLAAICAVLTSPASAQSVANMAALRGLAPVSVLLNTPAGRAALTANLSITGSIQSGALTQPLLTAFPDQQRQALKDAFITDGNASGLADGLGSKLSSVYLALAHYSDPDHFTNVSPAVAALFAYSDEVTYSDSGVAKFFFANETLQRSKPVSKLAAAIVQDIGGVTDIFGKAYDRVGGTVGADAYGNSRPFQSEPSLTPIAGVDFFGAPSNNAAYLRGPAQDLTNSPSFPSGHTTYGYLEAVLLAILVPERYQQEVTRAAEYGNDRIIIGAHYAMDVIGGRTLALYDLAHLLANDPAYVGQTWENVATITDYQTSLKSARDDLTAALQSGCGDAVFLCAAADAGRFKDQSADDALTEATQTYGLPVVYQSTADKIEDVGQNAPEAGYLLTAAFPNLTLAQADEILTSTEGPGGGFLDDGSAFGIYSRLNLFAAAGTAKAIAGSR